jgi:hypothetical protein
MHLLSLFHTLTGSVTNMQEYYERFRTLDAETARTRSAAFLGVEPVVLQVLPQEAS